MNFSRLNGKQVGVVLFSQSLKIADVVVELISLYGENFLTPREARVETVVICC